MGTTNLPPPLDELLTHEGFIRAIARGVLGADPQVEDVVQDTLLTALRGGPRQAGALRRWLGAVARNASLQRRRADTRRTAREARAPERTAAPTAELILAREESRRRLIEHLLALDEPYRGALLLRYYTGLPVKQVAEHLDVPLETARTRLRRGLAALRRRLDADGPGRGSDWRAALTPLAADGGAGLASTVAGTGLGKLLAAAALLSAIGVGAWYARDPTSDARSQSEDKTSIHSSIHGSEDAQAERPVLARSAIQPRSPRAIPAAAAARPTASPTTAQPTASAAAQKLLAEFVVVDAVSGQALKTAQVSVTCSWVRVLPAASGAFALHGEDLPLPVPPLVLIHAAGHMPQNLPLASGSAFPSRVALQPAGIVRGLVMTEAGEPVVGATVRIGNCRTQSDDNGRFTCSPLPLGQDLRPHAQGATGRYSLPHASVRLESESSEVLITLRIAEGRVHVVEVRSEDDVAIPNARVHLEFADRIFPPVQLDAQTNAAGIVVLRGLRTGSFWLHVRADGFDTAQPRLLELPEDAQTGHTVVVLPPGRIHWVGGTVTDPKGIPLQGVDLHVSVDQSRRKLRARSDERGRFRIRGVPHRYRYSPMRASSTIPIARVYLRKKGWAAPTIYDLPLDQEVSIVMARPGGVTGRVLDRDGRPLAKFNVSFHPDDVGAAALLADPFQRAPVQDNEVFRTTSRGRFSSQQLMGTPGWLWLGALDKKGRVLYGPLRLRLEILPGETIDLGDLVLPWGARLQGRVLSSHAMPGDDLRTGIRIFSHADGAVLAGARLGDGRYGTKRLLPAGSHGVLFLRKGHVSAPASATLVEGETRELDLVVWRAAQIRVQVVDESGPQEVRLRYGGPHGAAFHWRTAHIVRRGQREFVERNEVADVLPVSTGGAALFMALPPGRYELDLLRAGAVVASTSVELEEGQARVVRLPTNPK